MARKPTSGVFCVEAAWSPRLTDRTSVLPLLETLERVGAVRSIHDKVHTRDEFLGLVRRWSQRQYDDYKLGYLVGHGSSGTIHVGRRRITLEDLADELAGKLQGKTVHFGSCSIFDVEQEAIEEFRRLTNAKAVCGYTEDVDWLESAAFDLLLCHGLTCWTKSDAVDRFLQRSAGGLYEELGFEYYYG